MKLRSVPLRLQSIDKKNADGETRTRKAQGHTPLKRACLPIPPHPQGHRVLFTSPYYLNTLVPFSGRANEKSFFISLIN